MNRLWGHYYSRKSSCINEQRFNVIDADNRCCNSRAHGAILPKPLCLAQQACLSLFSFLSLLCIIALSPSGGLLQHEIYSSTWAEKGRKKSSLPGPFSCKRLIVEVAGSGCLMEDPSSASLNLFIIAGARLMIDFQISPRGCAAYPATDAHCHFDTRHRPLGQRRKIHRYHHEIWNLSSLLNHFSTFLEYSKLPLFMLPFLPPVKEISV